jgi:hypothetical protein
MPRKRSFLYSQSNAWRSGEQWSNTAKPWDYRLPFHRINSPAYDTKVDDFPGTSSEWRQILDGLGCKCGCHAPDEYEPGLLDTFFKTITDTLGIPTSLDDLLKQIDKVLPGDDAATKAAREALKKAIKDGAEKASKELANFDLAKWLGGFLEKAFLHHLMRHLPAWAPVERGDHEVKEIEGVAFNSFLDHRSFPYAQWHRWYDWNFQIIPYRGYQYLQSKGNDLFGSVVDAEWSVDNPFDLPSYAPWIMECKWDAGAIGGKANDPGTYVPPMLAPPSGILGAAHDWCWPQPGQYVWLSGRWVYNCQDASTSDTKGLMRSELHPCGAIATARWEAVAFPENQRPVPAIQFMFFMNRKGSYVDLPEGADKYEFIVDLPPVDLDKVVYPVGSTHPVGAKDATEMFPLNTLVVRPRLLQRFDVAPFAGLGNQAPLTDPPKIELLKPLKDEQGLYQARVTVNVGKAEVYGVIASLGWHDPGNALAARVKRVRIKFDSFRKHGINHDKGGEEWTLNVGVNGRWLQFKSGENAMHNDTDHALGAELVLHLHEDDYLTICAHGTEGDGEDDYMRRVMTSPNFFEDRSLRSLDIEFIDIPGADKLPSPWDKLKIPKSIKFDHTDWSHIDIRPAGKTESTEEERKKVSGLARDFGYQGILLADEHNDMLGRISPQREPTRVGDAANQIQLRELIGKIGLGKSASMILTAYEFRDLRDAAEAQFHLNSADGRESIRDYTLAYTVSVEEAD